MNWYRYVFQGRREDRVSLEQYAWMEVRGRFRVMGYYVREAEKSLIEAIETWLNSDSE